MRPESWGSGFVDYPSMVQPILDRHCASCHGGEKGIEAGLDLSGGWTEHFNISYESLVNRRETQLMAYWISGIDCMNGTALWSAQIFPPRSHGSGVAPLANLLVDGHGGRIPNFTRRERDMLMAWMDSNGLYYGTWDYTKHGYSLRDWGGVRDSLASEMKEAGCLRCHGDGERPFYFENDWFNLKEPQLSRILRAPLPAAADGLGLGSCRDRKVDAKQQRLHFLRNGYAHAVLSTEKFPRQRIAARNGAGDPVVSFVSTNDPQYQKMLGIIQQARVRVLATPRIDMPGAQAVAGACRHLVPPELPLRLPNLQAHVDGDEIVLSWERSARTIGLEAEVHRSDRKNFKPTERTRLTTTSLFQFADKAALAGTHYYALVLVAGDKRSPPSYREIVVAQRRVH